MCDRVKLDACRLESTWAPKGGKRRSRVLPGVSAPQGAVFWVRRNQTFDQWSTTYRDSGMRDVTANRLALKHLSLSRDGSWFERSAGSAVQTASLVDMWKHMDSGRQRCSLLSKDLIKHPESLSARPRVRCLPFCSLLHVRTRNPQHYHRYDATILGGWL